MPDWLTGSPGRWRLAVLAQPGASRSEVVGDHDGRLRVRLAAPPVDGRANAELIAFLARRLGLPKSSVRIARGEASRRKEVALDAALTAEAVVSGLR